MQRGRCHIATDPNPRFATKNLNVSKFMGSCLGRLDLAGHRRCHDRKKLGHFGCLASDTLRTELARSVLTSPFEQHVGIEPMAQRQFRDGYVRFAGFNRQSALEFSRIIEPTRPTPRNNFICIQNGPRYFVWRAPLSRNFTLFARRPQSDAYPSSSLIRLIMSSPPLRLYNLKKLGPVLFLACLAAFSDDGITGETTRNIPVT